MRQSRRKRSETANMHLCAAVSEVVAPMPSCMSEMRESVRETTGLSEQVEQALSPQQNTASDIIIIGGGPGGYVAAIRAAQLGGRAVLVEKDELGGVCLNRGCIPTKAMLSSAAAYDMAARRAEEFGVKVEGVSLDYGRMVEHRRKVVKQLVSGVGSLMRKHKVTVLKGAARIASSTTVEVTMADGKTQTVEGRNIIIATGSEPVDLPVPGLEGANIWDSDGALQASALPGSLLVIGGGAIGVEWGYMFKVLGSEVTIVEMMPQLLPLNDSEIARELKKALEKKGIRVLTESRVTKVEHRDGRETATVEMNGTSTEMVADKVLVAVGRRPVSSGLGLESIGVATERGKVLVDEHMRTNVPNVYAIGDVVGGMLLAHKASEEGVVAAENCMGRNRKMNYKSVPACVYTDPEVATVGMTEDAAKSTGIDYKVGKFPFRANGKALAMGEPEGFVKFVTDARYGEILGCHIIGPHATDLIHEVVIAMDAEATIDQIGQAVHAHPTLAEAVKEAALDVDGEALNKG